MSFGTRWVAPILPDFFRRYPDIALDLHLSDEKIDLIGDSFDAPLRIAVLIRYPMEHGGRPMNASDRFLRFAAECEVMAKFTPSPENEAVWHRMAERWIRCAELLERQETMVHTTGSMKRHRKSAQSFAHYNVPIAQLSVLNKRISGSKVIIRD
jgi:DNA-binding transcriptional LysR family regulator